MRQMQPMIKQTKQALDVENVRYSIQHMLEIEFILN